MKVRYRRREVTSSQQDGVLMRVIRSLMTPALLAASVIAWVVLYRKGVPSLVSSLLASPIMVAGLLVLERTMPRPDLEPRRPGTLRSDVAFTAITAIIAVAVPSLVVIPLGYDAAAVLGAGSIWPARMPLWASAVTAVLVADFTSYWWHRLQHTTGESWLWRLHSVHHSPRHFDFWMGARVHPFDTLGFTIVSYGVLAALGTPRMAIEISAFFAAMVGAVHHTRVDTDCGLLNRALPFADHHVVHHSIFPHDAGNYGNITTLFDQLFATYRAPTPRGCAPVGAWSLAESYPQGAYAFQLLSPFGRFWTQATSSATLRHVESRTAALGSEM